MPRKTVDLTLAQAATLCGLRPDSLRHAIHRGRLKARKPGHDWLITERDLDLYLESRQSWRDHYGYVDEGEETE